MTQEIKREHHQREVDALTPDYDLIPPHLRGGMREYIQRGHLPGHFLQAVIANDLNEALSRGDQEGLIALQFLTMWLYNDAPGGSWGSRGILHAWSQLGGLEGRARLRSNPPPPLTLIEVEVALSGQDIGGVAMAMTEWHPTILAEMLKAVTEARYIRYQSSHPDWTAAVQEVADKAGLDLPSRPANPVIIRFTPDHHIVFYLDGQTLRKRSTHDGGGTWGDPLVVREGIMGFSAQYYPEEERIKGVTWCDFKTDEYLGLIDIRPDFP